MRVIVVVALCVFTMPACPCGGVGEDGDGGGACAFAATPPPGSSGGACSSGVFWQGGDEESPVMHPGVDCIACHASRGEGPRYAIAGTVMGGAHDVDDCQGISAVEVRVTDANGALHTTTTNAAGNFFLEAAVAMPYTVELARDGRTTQMVTPQSTGDCLSCHTTAGAVGAPGRIVAP
jgi:hypothetical protein